MNHQDLGSWSTDFFTELNLKIIEGWSLLSQMHIGSEFEASAGYSYNLFMLRRPLEQD